VTLALQDSSVSSVASGRLLGRAETYASEEKPAERKGEPISEQPKQRQGRNSHMLWDVRAITVLWAEHGQAGDYL